MSVATPLRGEPTPAHARVCAADGMVLELTAALLDVGAGGGLWHVVNLAHGLLLEDPGSALVPVDMLPAVAATLRGYLGDSALWPDVRSELESVADFLTAAHDRGVAVKFLM